METTEFRQEPAPARRPPALARAGDGGPLAAQLALKALSILPCMAFLVIAARRTGRRRLRMRRIMPGIVAGSMSHGNAAKAAGLEAGFLFGMPALAFLFAATARSGLLPIESLPNILVALKRGLSNPCVTYAGYLAIPAAINLFSAHAALEFFCRERCSRPMKEGPRGKRLGNERYHDAK